MLGITGNGSSGKVRFPPSGDGRLPTHCGRREPVSRLAAKSHGEVYLAYLDRLRSLLAGVAAGLFIAVLYLRVTGNTEQRLDELRDGALLMIVASAGLTLWLGAASKKKAA